MAIETIDSLEAVPAAEWNALIGADDNPFLRHEFLVNLERHGCVGPHWGWRPQHLLLREGGRLLGAVPLYLKDNSYGELVFDWAWADAYQRAGLPYYPKLVAAVPYTPASGRRLLCHPEAEREATTGALMDGALELARELGVSSLHWLFPHAGDLARLEAAGFMPRLGCQFHWHNRGYGEFDDFLQTFTAQKRKQVRRERRRVAESGIGLEVVHGHEADDAQWAAFYRFYTDTFERRGGYATLTLEFFRAIGRELGKQVVLVLARNGSEYVAGALNLRGRDTLYGRHWGSSADYHSLHFEACYYSGIDYCIRHGLQRFEPGAQGEYKVARGFEPVETWSAHWLAEPRFAEAIGRYLEQERELMYDYMAEQRSHLPFRREEAK